MKTKSYYSLSSISSIDIKKISKVFSDVETRRIDVSVLASLQSHLYKPYKHENENKELRNKWLDYVSQLTIDFSQSQEESCFTALLEKQYGIKDWMDSCNKFDNAISAYIKVFDESRNFKIISDTSAKNFLYLIPTISAYSHCVSIDADTGYFNLTFKSKDSGLMTVLITDRGDLHYSLAERGKKLVKISGTANIKDAHDFAKFNKVLAML